MNRQKLFDNMVKHLRKQDCKALNNEGGCAYKTKDGFRCGIGGLIPPRLYSRYMERKTIDQVLNEGASVGIALNKYFRVKTEEDIIFLNSLQMIHDCHSPHEWEKEFEEFAKGHNLKFRKKT